jgi:signal transduction histidine kinase
MIEMPKDVLLIEDNPADARLIREALSSERACGDVRVFEGGAEALESMARKRPDLVLLDLKLPGMSGSEVLSRIKDDPELRRVPVVVLSGSSWDVDIIGAFNLRADHYIVKPSDLDGFPRMARSLKEFWRRMSSLPPCPSRVRVLLIEDSETQGLLFEGMLKECEAPSFEVAKAGCLSWALGMLSRREFDAVLLDLTLPDSLGLDTFAAVAKAAPRTPVIVLTAIEDKDMAAKAVRAGAQDYLIKSKMGSAALSQAVQYALARKAMERGRETFSEAASLEIERLLALVSGGIASAMEEPLKEGGRQALASALRGVGRLRRTIESLLEAAGIASKAPPAKEPSDILALARGVISRLRAAAEIEEDFPPGALEMPLDRAGTVEIFDNLVGNAVRFSPKGRVKVRIEDKGREVECSVCDDGRGIDEGDLPKAFLPFQRFGPPEEEPGCGLGLFIARKLVERQDGTISMTSRPGRGTKVVFSLPK